MADEGWMFGEKDDVLGLDIPPIAPVDARRGLGDGHLGRTGPGKRREKQIANEQTNLKRDYRERMAAEKDVIAARKGKPKCKPCKNRSRACDLERPVCGKCKELNIAAKCIYRSALDQDNAAPPSPNSRMSEDPTSPDISMVDAPLPAVSPNRAVPHRTALRQTTPLVHSDQSSVEGHIEGSPRKQRERKRKRNLAGTEGNDNNDGMRYDDKRRRLGGPGS